MLTSIPLPSVALIPVTRCSFTKFFMASKVHTASHSIGVEEIKKPFAHTQKVYLESRLTMPPEKVEIFKSMEGWARDNILSLLKPPQKSWQPQDFLPDAASDGFMEQVSDLRERASQIPDDYFVVLVGDMITEEALGQSGLGHGVLKKIGTEIFSINTSIFQDE